VTSTPDLGKSSSRLYHLAGTVIFSVLNPKALECSWQKLSTNSCDLFTMKMPLLKLLGSGSVQILLGLIGTGIASIPVLAQVSLSPAEVQAVCATNPANPLCKSYTMPTEGVRSTVPGTSSSVADEIGGKPVTPGGSAAIQSPYSVPSSPISPYPSLRSTPISPVISPVPGIGVPGISSPVIRPW
jgi:hypothetical protein